MKIDPASDSPLYQQVAADIRAKIASGELPLGVQLSPHRKLALDYSVSIMTINKSLAALVSEGLITSRVGRGSFVAAKPNEKNGGGRAGGGGTRRRLIGFVLRDLESPYFSLIVRGAQDRAAKEGYGLLLSTSSNNQEREDEQIRQFQDLGVDGLIIASMSRAYRPSEAVQALHKAHFPYVMVSYTEGQDIPFIGTDYERVGFLATEHLIRLGRQRIGCITEREGGVAGELRRRGYRRALAQYGLPVYHAFELEYAYEGEWNDYRSGYEAGELIAGMATRPDAMFVYNDLGAIGFEDALLDRGIRVPADIALVGVDDIEQSGRARVPLSTVRQPTQFVGALAVESLVKRIRSGVEEPVPRRLLEPELVVRRSCGAVVEAGV